MSAPVPPGAEVYPLARTITVKNVENLRGGPPSHVVVIFEGTPIRGRCFSLVSKHPNDGAQTLVIVVEVDGSVQ